MTRLFFTGIGLCVILLLAGPTLRAGEKLKTENDKIEAMIAHVEGMKQAKFVRNGVEYDARIAGKFLRYIWNANQAKVKSAEDFIRVVGTASGAGVPYLVRFEDGRQIKSRDYLTKLLAKLEMTAQE